MNHMMCNPLFGKQESQESIQESQNQAKILKDSRIMSIKIQSCGPLASGFIKHTDKLNENTREEQPVSHKFLVYKSTTLSHNKFQHIYSFNHVALENISPVLAPVPCCHMLSYAPLK